MTTALRDFELLDNKLNVLHVSTSLNAAVLANQICKAIQNAGIQSTSMDRLVGFNQNPLAKGISIIHGTLEEHKQSALHLAKAFDALEIPIDFDSLDSIGDHLLIHVGHSLTD